ncbi:sensor histidine kinase KdpD [uncultured Clostridium sp.]|uniref:sensor histidine kinase n=1 Tax=uncultured Clostridium sp. TaxID=59620 RepID=UPI0025CE3E56|nr:HAMP domain-containing sensor histidine kinase [uncultured Clostridium sp.]
MGRELCKNMIEYLKENPLFKRAFITVVSGTMLISMAVCFLHYYMINKIYVNQMNSTVQLVGSLARSHPEDEVEIVKTILLKKYNSEDLNYGESIIKKYGYDDEVKAWNDAAFNKNVYDMAIDDLVVFILALAGGICIFRYCSLRIIEELEEILNVVDKIIDGKFSIKADNDKEGILSKIYSGLYQMTRILELNINKLDREKENIKSLVTDISHQIKTPLSSIKLFNSLLIEDENMNTDERREFLHTIKEEVLKLEWLTGSLIKLSRLEAGMITFKKEKKSIKDTIYKSIKGVYSKALHRNIEIDAEDIHEYFVFHDPRWTKEAIINVLENAIKYTDSGGKINISMIETNFFIRIDIEDNGIGIPKKDFNKIFKRFYRGNSRVVQECEGSGVGLYLTRRILEQQGGNIMVDSEVGKGSRFSLFLQKCK